MDYKEYFKGKKITQLGLGLLGRGLGDSLFLAECGAELIVTDLKTEEDLKTSVEKLKQYSNITLHLGGHSLEDFRDRDFILKGAGVPLDSIYIEEARKNNIPIEMDSSLFCKLLPKEIVTIGVTGTRGKSTVTHLINHILKTAGKKTVLGGNVRDMATLPFIKDIKGDEIVVLELDSWQLQGFGESKISPHVSVFTTFMPDHLNYYKNDLEKYFDDKANIFKFQEDEDFLIVGDDVVEKVTSHKSQVTSQMRIAKRENVPSDWQSHLLGEHNKLNIACAIEACRAVGISNEDIKRGVETFSGVEGRLQFVKEVRGVKIYNDNNSTTPEATIVGLTALGNDVKRNIVLVIGGDDKKLDTSKLVEEIPRWCSKVVMFKERGTDTIREKILDMQNEGIKVFEEEGLESTVNRAIEIAEAGETILYSPAFSSFGKYFKNEYDRGDQFLKIIDNLK